MKVSKAFVKLVLAAAVIFTFLFVEGKYGRGPHHLSTRPNWSSSLSTALQSAKLSGKPIFLEFSATWCGPCRDMEREVFSTSEFQDVAKHFELVSIDVDEQKSVANKFGVNPIPDMRILDSDGKQVQKIEGFTEATELQDIMKSVLAKK